MSGFCTYPSKDQCVYPGVHAQRTTWRMGFCVRIDQFNRYKLVRFSHLVLAFLLLLNSSGLSVFRSFCCEKLTSVSLYAPAQSSCEDSCAASCEDMDDSKGDAFLVKNGCCRFAFDFYKWLTDIKVENNLSPQVAGPAIVPSYVFFVPEYLSQLPPMHFFDLATRYKDITLWNQVFRL